MKKLVIYNYISDSTNTKRRCRKSRFHSATTCYSTRSVNQSLQYVVDYSVLYTRNLIDPSLIILSLNDMECVTIRSVNWSLSDR